jgi:hypothetical protein
VRSDGFADAGEPAILLAGEFNCIFSDRLAGHFTFKQPRFRSHCSPVAAQGLGDAQASSVARSQDRSVLGVSYAAQKLEDFLGTQDYGQLLRLSWRRDDILERPFLLRETL